MQERQRDIVYSAVKLSTGIFNGTRPTNKTLLRVADRGLEVRKSGNDPKGLIGINVGWNTDG
jgi:hypothetical protein